MRYFNEAYVTGSNNYKLTNIVDNGNSKPHTVAIAKYYKHAVNTSELKRVPHKMDGKLFTSW